MFLGIDIGTQSLKVVVTDARLAPMGAARAAYRPSFPQPGWAEQDPQLWEHALAPTIAKALTAAGGAPDRVRGIGFCGQLDGCVPVDAAGRALHPCLLWMDRRADTETHGISGERIRRQTGIVLDASHLAAKIAWLKHNRPELRAARYHQPVTYMVERLTGEAAIDPALASTSMLCALGGDGYDQGLLDLFGVAAGEVPPIAAAVSCAGRLHESGAALTGLPRGIPVAVGTGDDFSTVLGAGLVAPGRIGVGLGTGEVVGAIHEKPVIDDEALVETHAYPAGNYFIENPGWLSGGAVVWLMSILGLSHPAELDALAQAAPPGAAGVIFLPALSGAMAPRWRPTVRGCFHGLTASHGRAHMARALLEGCAFAMRDVILRLDAMGVRGDTILLLGGGARSRVWSQIRADVAGRAAIVPRHVDTSPIGAAMLAAVAGGAIPDLADAAKLVGGGEGDVQPRQRPRRDLRRCLCGVSPPVRVTGAHFRMIDQDPIARLLAGTYPDPDGGKPLTVATRKVVIAPSLAGDEASCADGLPLGSKIAVVSDKTTHAIMGANVERALAGRGKVISIVLPDRPHADEETAHRVAAASSAADSLVAVGSGTLNDLCKYVSAGAGKPYVVYGTAPSMNGFVSTNAAITVHGHKKSLAAQAPLGAFLDLAVMAAAPPRMIRSGLGDSLCRPTAQADWLLAHHLLGQSYRQMPFTLLATDEPDLFEHSGALVRGDLAAMERLVRTLLLSGFGTAICGNSRPASQGEHLISHFMDMFGDPAWPPAFHGEQIAVTTLTMARLQERLLDSDAPRVRADATDKAALISCLGAELGPSCWADFSQKRLDRKTR